MRYCKEGYCTAFCKGSINICHYSYCFHQSPCLQYHCKIHLPLCCHIIMLNSPLILSVSCQNSSMDSMQRHHLIFWPGMCGHSLSSLNQPATSLSPMRPLSNRRNFFPLPQHTLLFSAWWLCSWYSLCVERLPYVHPCKSLILQASLDATSSTKLSLIPLAK